MSGHSEITARIEEMLKSSRSDYDTPEFRREQHLENRMCRIIDEPVGPPRGDWVLLSRELLNEIEKTSTSCRSPKTIDPVSCSQDLSLRYCPLMGSWSLTRSKPSN